MHFWGFASIIGCHIECTYCVKFWRPWQFQIMGGCMASARWLLTVLACCCSNNLQQSLTNELEFIAYGSLIATTCNLWARLCVILEGWKWPCKGGCCNWQVWAAAVYKQSTFKGNWNLGPMGRNPLWAHAEPHALKPNIASCPVTKQRPIWPFLPCDLKD